MGGTSQGLSSWDLADKDILLGDLEEADNSMEIRKEPSKHDHRFHVISYKYLCSGVGHTI